MKSIGNHFKTLAYFCAFAFVFIACEDYDEKAIAVAGSYDAHILNGIYEFDLDITLDGDDNVLLEGLFDDYDWEIIRADLDNRGDGNIDIDIYSQNVYSGAELWGDGIWSDGYLQLDYKIDWGGDIIRYTLSANQY